MKTIDEFKRNLKPGQVYRRADLIQFSRSMDRHLRDLVDAGVLKKLWFGVYHFPRKCTFGDVPAEEEKVVATFLNDRDFLMLPLHIYNDLGVGTTQLYNERLVYNHKRTGHLILNRRRFFFLKNRKFPKKISKEFLLVDLVNNIRYLAENRDEVMERVAEKVQILGVDKMCHTANHYGLDSTKKFFERISN